MPETAVLTKRQWVILQRALVLYACDLKGEEVLNWDYDSDGKLPTKREIDRLAEVVGRLPHEK